MHFAGQREDECEDSRAAKHDLQVSSPALVGWQRLHPANENDQGNGYR